MRDIYRMLIFDGLSIYAIARELNTEGINYRLMREGPSACCSTELQRAGSRIRAAKLLLFNSGFTLIFVLLRVILKNVAFHFPPVSEAVVHRIFRAWWLSECSTIIHALIAAGLK